MSDEIFVVRYKGKPPKKMKNKLCTMNECLTVYFSTCYSAILNIEIDILSIFAHNKSLDFWTVTHNENYKINAANQNSDRLGNRPWIILLPYILNNK